MNGIYHKRLPAMLGCILIPLAVGCANFGSMPSWMPFTRQASNDLPGLTPPAERIDKLRDLAKDASRSTPQQAEQTCLELAGTIRVEEDPMIRAEIVRTLGAYRGLTADSVLRAAVDDPDEDVRIAACEAWGKRRDAAAAGALGEVLADDIDTDVRLAAARALGESSDAAAVVALGTVLADKDPALQYRAVLSLRKITGKNFDNDVRRWQQYVRTTYPQPADAPSVAGQPPQKF